MARAMGHRAENVRGACTVSADGVRSAACQRCLVEPEWDALRSHLGTDAVRGRRSVEPTLIQGAWTSASVGVAMMRILSEELLGYSPQVVAQVVGVDAVGQILACKGVDVEVWGSGEPLKERDAQTERKLRERNLGAVAYQGLYAPAYTSFVSAHHRALSENTVQWLDDGDDDDGGSGRVVPVRTMDTFPADGTTGPGNLSAWCADQNEFCCTAAERRALEWNVSSCVQGRWYPPQCGVDSSDAYPSRNCKELYLANMDWSVGWYESLIKNGGWNFSAVYLGYTGMQSVVAELTEQKRDFLYYWWEPEHLHMLYPSQRVVLPARDDACNDAKANDPLLSSSYCGQGSTVLKKWISEELAQAEPDLLHLFDSWELSKGDLDRMVAIEKSAGGNFSIEEAACVILKSERMREKWKPWIRIESPCAWKGKGYTWSAKTNACMKDPASPVNLFPAVISAAVIGALLAAATIGLTVRHKRLKVYIEKLEQDSMSSSGDVDYVTPISEAIRILKEISGVRRVTQDLKQSAVVTVKNLLTKDIFAPDYEGQQNTSGPAYGEAMRKVARHWNTDAVANSQPTLSAWMVKTSRESRISSTSSADAGESIPGTVCLGCQSEEDSAESVIKLVDEMLRPLNAHTLSIASIGTNLMQDTLSIKVLTQGRPLTVSALLIMRKYDLFRGLRLAEKPFARWLMEVEQGYMDVPYHNAVHAADVLSRLMAILRHEHIAQDCSLSSMCTLLACIMATVIHDYGHPGLDNKYLVDSDSEVSRRFNQRAVLENHSLYRCLEMLRQKELNPLANAEFNKGSLLSLVIKLVLATDMADHFFIVSEFKSKVCEKARALSGNARPALGDPQCSASFFEGLDEWDKVKVLMMAMKVADVGHLYTPFSLHSKWTALLEDEYFRQGQLEIAAGREPGFLKDPRKAGVTDAEHAVAFYNVIGLPLVQVWADVFPNSGMALLEHGSANRKKYADHVRRFSLERRLSLITEGYDSHGEHA